MLPAEVSAVHVACPGDVDGPYCLVEALPAMDAPAWGDQPPPWAPGRREEVARVDRMGRDQTVYDDRLCLLSEVDIFADLTTDEMRKIAEAAPMRTYAPGEMLYTPHQPVEALFILKRGRVRVFRVSADGRALTTAMITPGTIFGEMVLLGQQMYDNYAEALEESLVCVMSRADVHRFLLADPRIAARITAILGERLAVMERRLSDSIFKTVPQRVAATLLALSAEPERRPGRLSFGQKPITITHEQLAALVGTSRETAMKALGELAEQDQCAGPHAAVRRERRRMIVTWVVIVAAVLALVVAAAASVYIGLVTGALTVDVGRGRRLRPLGPLTNDIAAERDIVFDLLAQPYLGRTTRAMQEKVRVLERGSDMVLAAHRTPVGARLTAVTVETVRFTAPARIDFRLVRGPVPHVVEEFTLTELPEGTRLRYRGELGTDGWAIGGWWGRIVGDRWQAAVAATFDSVKAEAERRAARG
jgi:CRP/FNR family transcriptional regulator, cyclic AMP receptor protein